MCRLILVMLVVHFSPAFCSFDRLTIGAESMGLGNSLTAYPFTPYVVYYNPANLIYHRSDNITLNYRTFYGISGLVQGDITGLHNIFGTALGWGLNYYGNELYQEYRILLAGGWPIVETVSLGIGLSLHHLSITGYGQTSALGLNFSVSSRLTDQIYCGALVCNLNRPDIGKSKESLPQSLDLGLCYLTDDGFLFTLSISKETRYKPEIRAGIGYNLLTVIILRGGIEDRLECFSMGFGLKLTKFRFDYAIAVHPVLDASHTLSFMVEL